MRLQIVGFIIGALLLILAAAMLIPAAADFTAGAANAHIFLYCAAIAFFFGGLLFFGFRNAEKRTTLRQIFLLTTLSWGVLSLFSALPLYFSDLDISFTDALFESVSGVTTTGSTVLSGLDSMSPGILLWRAVTQWIGGIGVVAFAIVLLPFLRVGGMQIFQMESSDRSDKILPQTGDTVMALVQVYAILTLCCFAAYDVLGMTPFDAFIHALTTLSTGGYSTHDASFGFFKSPALETAATLFMFLGGLPFILYVKMLHGRRGSILKDVQVRGFVVLVAATAAFLTLFLWLRDAYDLGDALRYALFNVISVVTTTGYATADYTLWGAFPIMLFFFLTYLGACAGSTSGGIKMVRLVVALATVRRQIAMLLNPHGVFTIRYQGKSVDLPLIQAIIGFLCLYVTCNVLLTIALAATGLDITTAVSGAATALANVGPGLGDTIGPAGNFSTLPNSAKWLLCVGMVLGRLEIMTVLILAVPGFWKV